MGECVGADKAAPTFVRTITETGIGVSIRQKLTLASLLILTLSSVAWTGTQFAKQEESAFQKQIVLLFQAQIHEVNRAIDEHLQHLNNDLQQQIPTDSMDSTVLRGWLRSQPRVNQLFMLNSTGQILHPAMNQPLNEAEQDFMIRSTPFLVDREFVVLAGVDEQVGEANQSTSRLQDSGWFVWHWGRGLHLILWKRLEDGRVIGLELERARWIADLIGALPATTQDQFDERFRIRLVDSDGNLVYQWGDFEFKEDVLPVVESRVSEPLSSWRLQYFADSAVPSGSRRLSAWFNIVGGVTAFGVALIALSVSLYRESTRNAREAETRVSFVNQVSHELKTPLTNIRLYAELMEADLHDDPAEGAVQAREKLKIVLGECSRLSRLIGNVLEFSSQSQHATSLKRSPAVLDDVIQTVIRQFDPVFHTKRIIVEKQLMSSATVMIDVDAVEQMLVNLISNVEKYAPNGKWMRIESQLSNSHAVIRVHDRGPGIPPSARESVFQPFVRIENRLEGANGAGIGLTIARQLARLHGGDIAIIPSSSGACFQIDLEAPLVDGDAEESHS